MIEIYNTKYYIKAHQMSSWLAKDILKTQSSLILDVFICFKQFHIKITFIAYISKQKQINYVIFSPKKTFSIELFEYLLITKKSLELEL